MAGVRELAELATDQWGLVTAGQARSLGVTPQTMAKRAKAGDLVRVAHGVYRLAGTPIHQHQELRAAWLGLDPHRTAEERIAEQRVDVVSHQSAADVRMVGDLGADNLEFTVPQRRQTRRTDVRLHRGELSAYEWTLVDGLPVTTAKRTIEDLAAQRVDRGHLAGIVRDALDRRQVTEDELIQTLAHYAHGYGGRPGDGRRLLAVLLSEAGVQGFLTGS